MDDKTLAGKILKHLKNKPDATVQDLSKELGETEGRIVFILDEHRVEGNQISHAGPGSGGGWVNP